jgi:hypothetical protein
MVNEIARLAYIVGQIEQTQNQIVEVEGQLEASINGNETEESPAVLRDILNRLKALLGMLRNSEQSYLAELSTGKELRKAQGELGKG